MSEAKGKEMRAENSVLLVRILRSLPRRPPPQVWRFEFAIKARRFFSPPSRPVAARRPPSIVHKNVAMNRLARVMLALSPQSEATVGRRREAYGMPEWWCEEHMENRCRANRLPPEPPLLPSLTVPRGRP